MVHNFMRSVRENAFGKGQRPAHWWLVFSSMNSNCLIDVSFWSTTSLRYLYSVTIGMSSTRDPGVNMSGYVFALGRNSMISDFLALSNKEYCMFVSYGRMWLFRYPLEKKKMEIDHLKKDTKTKKREESENTKNAINPFKRANKSSTQETKFVKLGFKFFNCR